MNDPDAVARAQRRADAEPDVRDLVDRQRRFGQRQHGAQIAAAQMLHHQERRAVVGETVVQHLNDVALIDLRQAPSPHAGIVA